MKALFLLFLSWVWPVGLLHSEVFVSQNRVLEIQVQGNKLYSAEEIRGGMYTRVGESLDPKVLQQDIVFLWQKKRVRAQVIEEAVPGGVRLIVQVEEIPAIREVSIMGNREVKREDLLESAKLTPGVPVDEVLAARARSDMIQHYRDHGYFFADISLKTFPEQSRVVFEVMEGPLVRVSSVELEGNKAIPYSGFLRRDLKSVMKTSGSNLLSRGSEFKENTIREDLIELRRLYRMEGFRDAVIEIRDLEFNPEHDRVILRILVREGARYVVSSIDIEGNEAFPKEELLGLIRLKPGDYYLLESVERDRSTLARYYGDRGYPDHPSIKDHWRFLDPQEIYAGEEAKVALTYRIEEGRKIRIRDVQIAGNERTQDRVIRRNLTVKPGELVNTGEIGKSLMRINSLNYFQDERGYPRIGYQYADTEKEDEKDLVIKVEEGQTGQILFGGGVNSIDGLFGSLQLQKRNFDIFNTPSSWDKTFEEIFNGTAFTGAGQDLSLQLSPGTRRSSYNLRFLEPDLFGEHIRSTSMSVNLFERLRFFRIYDEKGTGAYLSFGKNWTENLNSFVSFRNERIELKNIAADAPRLVFDLEGGNALRSVGAGIGYANLDVPLDPNRGYSVQLTGELAGSLMGADFEYYKSFLDSRLYLPLWMDSRGRPYTLLVRGSFGIGNSYGDSPDLPYPVRYFAGGPDSVRGFGFRGIGPVQNDNPTGGEVVALAGTELRFPIYSTPFAEGLAETEWIRGVLFLDSGTVGLDLRDPTLREWRLSTGAGVRIKVPFLPQAAIILDYGVPLFKETTDSVRVFSFSIGTSF